MAVRLLQITELFQAARPKSGAPAGLDIRQRTATNEQLGYRRSAKGRAQPKSQHGGKGGKSQRQMDNSQVHRATAAAEEAAATWYANQWAAWQWSWTARWQAAQMEEGLGCR